MRICLDGLHFGSQETSHHIGTLQAGHLAILPADEGSLVSLTLEPTHAMANVVPLGIELGSTGIDRSVVLAVDDHALLGFDLLRLVRHDLAFSCEWELQLAMMTSHLGNGTVQRTVYRTRASMAAQPNSRTRPSLRVGSYCFMIA